MTATDGGVRGAVDYWVPRLTRSQTVTAVAVLLVAVQTAFRAWAVLGGWFYGDDLQWLSTQAHGDADLSWIFRAHDSQFMPVGLVLAKLAAASGIYNWPVAALEILVLQVVASLMCWRMLRCAFGSDPRTLVLLCLYLFSTLTFAPIMWWAAALNQIPLHIAMFGMITAHLSYLRDRTTKHLLTAGIWLTFGYLSYVKTLLLVFVVVSLALLYFSSGLLRSRLRVTLASYWRAWTAYGVITAGYLVVYLLHVPSPIRDKGPVDYGDLANAMFRRTLGPSLLGGPWQWLSFNDPLLVANPDDAVVSLAWVVVALLVAYLLVTRRRSSRALLIAVPYLLLNLYLVGAGRAYLLGAYAGLEVRYLSDFGALLPLIVGLMWLPVVDATESTVRRDTIPSLPHTRVALAALTLLLIVSSTASSIQFADAWRSFPVRTFISNARTDIEHADQKPVIPDIAVSSNNLGVGQNTPSVFLAPIRKDFSITVPANDLQTFDSVGHLRGATIVDGITTRPTSTSPCGLVVDRPTRVRLGARTVNYPFWMTVGYLAGGNGTATISAGEEVKKVPIQAGLHTVFLGTNGSFSLIIISPRPGTRICVDKIQVGQLSVS